MKTAACCFHDFVNSFQVSCSLPSMFIRDISHELDGKIDSQMKTSWMNLAKIIYISANKAQGYTEQQEKMQYYTSLNSTTFSEAFSICAAEGMTPARPRIPSHLTWISKMDHVMTHVCWALTVFHLTQWFCLSLHVMMILHLMHLLEC